MIEINKLHINGSRLPSTIDNNDIYNDRCAHLTTDNNKQTKRTLHSQRPIEQILTRKHSKQMTSFIQTKSIDHRSQVKHKSIFYHHNKRKHSHLDDIECSRHHQHQQQSNTYFSYKHNSNHFSRFYMILIVILIYLLETINCDQGKNH